MAIKFDATAQSGDSVASPVTWSHTIGTNANRVLVVCMSVIGASAAGTTTAVTYNGVSMTKVKTTTNSDVVNNWFLESTIWMLLNPTVGVNTVSATITAPSAPDYGGSSISYYNTNQSLTPDGSASNTGTTTGSLTPAITTTNAGAWIVSHLLTQEDGGTASSRVSNKTDRQTQGLASNLNGGDTTTDTNGTVSPGSNTISYTYTGGSGATTYLWANSMISLAPALFVTTQAVTSITTTTATGNGNITDIATNSPDERGIVYNTTTKPNPGNVAPGSSGYSGLSNSTGTFATGAFTNNLTGLTPGATYFVRAYVHDSVTGYVYGEEVQFATAVSLAWLRA